MIDLLIESTAWHIHEKNKIFSQMLDMARTCPGLQWDEAHQRWSSNRIYKEGETLLVVASVAETLNLVCQALLDPHQLEAPEAGTAQISDQHARVLSFGAALIKLQNDAQAQSVETCSTDNSCYKTTL